MRVVMLTLIPAQSVLEGGLRHSVPGDVPLDALNAMTDHIIPALSERVGTQFERVVIDDELIRVLAWDVKGNCLKFEVAEMRRV